MGFQKGNTLGKVNRGRKITWGYKIAKANSKRIVTEQQKQKAREAAIKNKNNPPVLKGKENPLWKGDKVSYNGLHHWVRRWLGNPEKCEYCGKEKTTPKSIQWANKSGKYKRNLSDFIALCCSCHRKYDNFLRRNKVYFPELSNIHPQANLGKNGTYHSGIHIHKEVSIGNNCQIEAQAFIPNGVTIEDDVFIGPQVCFTNDPTMSSLRSNWSPTATLVQKGAKIGAGARIRAGVKIGANSVIGMGSVVLHDVEPNSTVVGNPAHKIK